MDKIPSKGHFQYGGHFVPDMEPIALMQKTNTCGVFISRDMRDVIVSHAHFGIADSKRQGKHPIYPMFDTHDLDQVISWLIEVSLHRYWCRIRWQTLFPLVHSLRYEDLWECPAREIGRIATFLNIDLSEDELQGCVRDFPPDRGDQSYMKFYRQGAPGNWKNYFNEAHKARFKHLAGDMLIVDGYEENMDW